jgi:hypothetical protein
MERARGKKLVFQISIQHLPTLNAPLTPLPEINRLFRHRYQQPPPQQQSRTTTTAAIMIIIMLPPSPPPPPSPAAAPHPFEHVTSNKDPSSFSYAHFAHASISALQQQSLSFMTSQT